MRYAYRKTNGLAHDLRFVAEDYVLAADEFEGHGDPLPSLVALSDAAAVAAANAPKPDVAGFVTDLKAAMGGIVASNTLAKAYPLFQPALEKGVFADVQALVIDAHTTLVLSDAQYAAIKSLAAKHNIPISLP